jgi:transposase-like protein
VEVKPGKKYKCRVCGGLGHNRKRHEESRSKLAADMVEREGCTLDVAAGKFDITTQAVSMVLVDRNGPRRTPMIDMLAARSEERELRIEGELASIRESQAAARDAAVDLVRSGKSIASVSSQTGFSYQAVWLWCINAGVKSQADGAGSPRPGQPTRTAAGLKLLDSGMSIHESARSVGISPQALYRGLRRRNGEKFA